MKKLINSLFVAVLTTVSFAQNEEVHDAKIIGSFEIGNKEVTTIHDEVTGCNRKTSPHSKNLFTPNEDVQIKISDNKQMAEVIKLSLPEQVFTNKRCQTGEELSPEQISFLVTLNNELDDIINNNVIYNYSLITNPFEQFGADNRLVIEEIYNSKSNKLFTVPTYFSDYKDKMVNLGHASEITPLVSSVGLINKYNDGSHNSYQNLRYEVYEAYNVSNFSIQVSELIFSKLNVINSKEIGHSFFYKAEQLIFETTTINENEKSELLKSIAVGNNNLDFIEYAAVGGSWKDCASFVLSAVGGFMGGPFTMAFGVTGMALSAEGCEKYLGW